jgi:hypothetical protein
MTGTHGSWSVKGEIFSIRVSFIIKKLSLNKHLDVSEMTLLSCRTSRELLKIIKFA